MHSLCLSKHVAAFLIFSPIIYHYFNLTHMKKCLLLIYFMLSLCVFTQAQERIVSGKITSAEDNSPLPGVNVILKGTSIGTLSDSQGNYQITVSGEEPVLLFSYVGYINQEVLIAGQSVININLESDTQALDELVVIAYGETDKRKFTGSLTSVSAEDIKDIPQASPVQMLQGRSAGLLVNDGNGQPGAGGAIVIRGIGTLTGSTAPLYVIDGTPTNEFVNLNPNDIESISILKDGAATSIYGSRAANGVVLITTKQGIEGKTKFRISAQYGFSDIENPNDFRLMNAAEYTEYYREAALNAGENPDDPNSGFFLPDGASPFDTDWFDAVTQTGITQQYELSASGGSEKTKHYISVNYYRQRGNIIRTDYERVTGRINLSLNPVNRVNIDFRVLGAYDKQNERNRGGGGRAGQFSGAMQVSPRSPILANENTVLNGAGFNFDLPSNAGHNPVAAAELNTNRESSVRIFPTVKVTYEPIDNLKISTSGSLDWTYARENFFESKFYLAETDNGVANLGQNSFLDMNFNILASYDYQINDDHLLSALVGFEAYKEENTFSDAGSRSFAFEGINNFAAGGETNSSFLGYGFGSQTLAAFFARVNYTFKGKVFLNASLRRDGSSRFGPENRYGTFYAFGAGYNIIDEPFMESQNIFSDLRVRASYGITGSNSATGDFAWRPTFGAGGTFVVPPSGGGTGISNPGSQPTSPGNLALQWEQSEVWNFGLDFGLLNDRIGGTIEYYIRNSVDLISTRIISRTSGFNSISDNIGEIRNRGVEITLYSTNIQANDFSWTSDFNIAFNDNEIISLNGESDTLAGATTVNIVGQPLGQWYLPQYAGVDPLTGRQLYFTPEGNVTFNINNALTTVSGNTASVPDFFGSFTNTFTYKGLSLSFMFYFRYGTKIYRSLAQDLAVAGGNNLDAALLNRWQQPGDITNIPRGDVLVNDLGNSTRFLEDGSYIRLRNINLAYTFPNALTQNWGFSNITLSAQGVNVLTFTDYRGFNVDTGSFEDSDYPNTRTFTFGLSANF